MKKLQKLGYIALGAVLALTLNVTVPTLAAGTENVVKQLTAYFTSGGKPITIYVDGEKVNITQKDSGGNVVQPFVSDGATYLPVKTVAEAFGKTAEWEGSTASVYIGKRPGAEQYMTDILPAYQKSSDKYKEYSEIKSGAAESFTMGGSKYLNGFSFNGSEVWAVWNLNGQYASFTATLGHIDGSGNDDSTGFTPEGRTIQIFCDGKLNQEIPVVSSMLPQSVTLDLNGVNQLKIVSGANGVFDWYNSQYGFGNPVLK